MVTDMSASAPHSTHLWANASACRVGQAPVAAMVRARPAVRSMVNCVSCAISSSLRQKYWLSPAVSKMTPLPPPMPVSMMLSTPSQSMSPFDRKGVGIDVTGPFRRFLISSGDFRVRVVMFVTPYLIFFAAPSYYKHFYFELIHKLAYYVLNALINPNLIAGGHRWTGKR